MINKIWAISAIIICGLGVSHPAFSASSIDMSHANDKFQKEWQASSIEKIEHWDQPKRSATPKNLRSEQQVRYSGRTSDGKLTSWTQHITDYDTYITESFVQDGKYYVKDNLGRTFLTGADSGLTEVQLKQLEQVDKNTENIQNNYNKIIDNSNRITNNSNAISSLNNRMNTYDSRLNSLDKRVDKIQDRMESGFATMAALAALHPNPRAKSKTQVAVAGGMYRDNVAGAVGIFHNFKDNVMLSVGAAYGGEESWAGNVGLTFSW